MPWFSAISVMAASPAVAQDSTPGGSQSFASRAEKELSGHRIAGVGVLERERRLVGWPGLDTLPPAGNLGAARRSNHLRARQHLDAVDHWCHGDVGECEHLACQPGASSEPLLHLVEQVIELGISFVLFFRRYSNLQPAFEAQSNHRIGAADRKCVV